MDYFFPVPLGLSSHKTPSKKLKRPHYFTIFLAMQVQYNFPITAEQVKL